MSVHTYLSCLGKLLPIRPLGKVRRFRLPSGIEVSREVNTAETLGKIAAALSVTYSLEANLLVLMQQIRLLFAFGTGVWNDHTWQQRLAVTIRQQKLVREGVLQHPLSSVWHRR